MRANSEAKGTRRGGNTTASSTRIEFTNDGGNQRPPSYDNIHIPPDGNLYESLTKRLQEASSPPLVVLGHIASEELRKAELLKNFEEESALPATNSELVVLADDGKEL